MWILQVADGGDDRQISGEYIEQAAADSRQLVVIQLGGVDGRRKAAFHETFYTGHRTWADCL
jgi:hypothetical protein